MKLRLIIIIIVLLVLFAGKAYYDTHCIEVKHYEIKNSSLGELLSGLKVAHLSDLHIKKIGLMEKKILEILKEEKSDLIFITGDSIMFEGSYGPAMSFFRQLKPSLGTYAVLGNAEYSNENESCILCHEKKSRSLEKKPNPIVLRNSSIPLNIDGRVVNIIGGDDPVTKKSNLKAAIKKIDPGAPGILLAHSPEVFEEASEFKIDLLLSGHVHGGQIFLAKHLRNIFPLEASLGFLEGFFQKGKMLMYVSRGIGTSYLPFRLGVKPEITFFSFINDTNENIRMARINSSNSTNSTNPTNPNNPSNPINPSNPSNPITPVISNTPPKTFFIGLSLSNLVETFNILGVFESVGLTSRHSIDSSNSINPTNPINPSNPRNPINSITLFDFESESELRQLNWECHKWFELSDENLTSGKHSLKVTLPPGQFPGINFHKIRADWSGFSYLRMDVLNPSRETFNFHIRIDDNKSGWEYADRFDADFNLKPGLNNISVPTNAIQTNLYHRSLNLKRINRMMVFLTNNSKPRELYLDNIRLE